MSEILYPEWRNGNERIAYPFTDSATLVSTASVSLPFDTFDDARIYLIGAGPDLYLSSIASSITQVTLTITDSVTGLTCSGSFDPNTPPVLLALLDSHQRPAGVLVSDETRLARIKTILGESTALFTEVNARFSPSVIVPTPEVGVRGVLLDDSTLLTGDVWLVGTSGVVLRMEGGNIRVDVVGDPYAVAKACEEQGIVIPAFCGLKTINGVGPDVNGDFKLTPGSNAAPDNLIRIVQTDTGDLNVNPAVSEGCANG